EVANLPTVIADLKARGDIEILVVDDGSTDGTKALLRRHDVKWMRLSDRMGIGCAVRAGLRYAARLPADVVVRLDGDGQHGADDIDTLLAPVREGTPDVVIGSRFGNACRRPYRVSEGLLAACLSLITGRHV